MTRRTVLAAAAQVFVGGCQSKLNVEQSAQIEAGMLRQFEIDSPRYDQKVAVTVTADNPVNVYVFLQKDRDAAVKAIESEKSSDLILTSKEKATSETLEATVPAKQGVVVAVQTMAKAANVKLKIVGQ
jgi:hypothetical protein